MQLVPAAKTETDPATLVEQAMCNHQDVEPGDDGWLCTNCGYLDPWPVAVAFGSNAVATGTNVAFSGAVAQPDPEFQAELREALGFDDD